jgi:hypothetical protein
MEMRLESSMERWGIVGIFKEAAKLLHKHFRLFLPFFLAFHLPASFLAVFLNAFLAAHTRSFFSGTHITNYGKELKDTDNQPSLILTYACVSLIFIFSTLAAAAFTYTVDHIYTTTSDDILTKKIFKLLPYAFLRVFVTQIWTSLVMLLLALACFIIAFLLSALLSLLTGYGDPSGFTPAFTVLYFVPLVVGTIAVAVVFALMRSVAVLEEGNYGRAALKQSWRYARGRVGTIFGYVLFGELVGDLVSVHAHAVGTAGLSLGIKILLACAISVVFSLLSAYVELVGIVTYFVCRCGSGAALPVVTASAAENPYMPIVSGSTTQVGEP